LLARLGWKLRFGLGRESMYEFLRVAAINIYDVLNEQFEDDRLKAAIALDAVLGNAMGPRTPGTVLTWLSRLASEHAGGAGPANATLVPALLAAAEDSGATVRCACPVTRILIDADEATGVVLASGETIEAKRVVAAIDPRTTLSRLVGAPRLDTQFADRVTRIRGSGVVGKLHLGLSGLPAAQDIGPELLAERIVVAPSMRHIERAFNASKYGEVSARPVFEITVPSLADPSLAPEGHHVMSINVAYLPYRLKAGWDRARDSVVRQLCRGLDQVLPGLETLITDYEFLSPSDIETEYGAIEGHWHHGELSMHQSFMLRPLYGAAQYDTPVGGLYLCSAGCHPGGGVSGLPGKNAAARILDTGARS
jgi:phytoene dehydrogenase-like protein